MARMSHLGFAPKISPENFKAAFTTSEGWGSFVQKDEGGRMSSEIEIKFGQLRLKTLALSPQGTAPKTAKVTLDGKPVAAILTNEKGRALLTFANSVVVKPGQKLQIQMN